MRNAILPAMTRSTKLTAGRLMVLAALFLAAQGCQTTTVTTGGGGIVPMPLQPDAVSPPRPNYSVRKPGKPNPTPAEALAEKGDATDPCPMRLQDLGTPLYEYYIKYNRLPDKLEDLHEVADITTDLNFTCPESGKAYVYDPVGLQAEAGDSLHLILYDSAPVHNGARWGLVAGPTPNRDGKIFFQMVVVKLTPKVFTSCLLYTSHGSRLTRVDIGQNLRGELATPSGSLPPSSPGSDSPGIATGAPGSAAPAASPASVTGGSTDDIAEKLRRRRAAEGTGR